MVIPYSRKPHAPSKYSACLQSWHDVFSKYTQVQIGVICAAPHKSRRGLLIDCSNVSEGFIHLARGGGRAICIPGLVAHITAFGQKVLDVWHLRLHRNLMMHASDPWNFKLQQSSFTRAHHENQVCIAEQMHFTPKLLQHQLSSVGPLDGGWDENDKFGSPACDRAWAICASNMWGHGKGGWCQDGVKYKRNAYEGHNHTSQYQYD